MVGKIVRHWMLLLGVAVSLAVVASAYAAFQSLPITGTQVNSDLSAGINPSDPVALGDPTNAGVVGGALNAGKPAVPWAIFQQTQTTAGGHDQIFVRSFAAGAWSTRGIGTVGGRSSTFPTFTGSLNFDQSQDGEAPSIDFAGAGRTVPWATWYEDTAQFGGVKNIFASRFDNTGDANQNKWIFAGQSRGSGSGTNLVPSLNIHTNEDAENPAVAGGSAIDPTKPGPWVTWQEIGANSPGAGKDQIFVSKPIGPGVTNCDGVTPAGVPVSGHVPAVGNFCFQQVGVERLGSDPSLNVDRTRDGVEPDNAFTGANDSVPWVVWYEQNNSTAGLNGNEMVFAAKAVPPSPTSPPTGTVDGGFNWIVVGRTGSGVLDNTATGGPCAASQSAENGCSLNVNPSADAEDPRVAAGTMTPGNPTVPWVVWDEGSMSNPNGNSVFVAHLVSGQFVVANNGQPIGTGDRADITFSGNTPYVTWHNNNQVVIGHFATPNQFIKDNTAVGTAAFDNVRAPISSGCAANPFNGDGAGCQGGAIGTPFFLYTNGGPTNATLFGDAFQTDAPSAGTASGVTTSSATVLATVNPQGGPVSVHFEFGPTTNYGGTTSAQRIAPTDSPALFTGLLTGLTPGATLHYRAVAQTDFGTVDGPDATLTTQKPPDHTPPAVSMKVKSKKLKIKHHKLSLQITLNLSSSEASTAQVSGTVIVVKRHKRHTVTVMTGSAQFRTAGVRTLTLKPSHNGANTLLSLFVKYPTVKLTFTDNVTDTAGNRTTKHLTTTLHR
jgi:hypothetical protein